MTDLARDRNTIGTSLANISDLTVVVADLLRQGRPLLKSRRRQAAQLAKLLNKPKNQQQIIELLDRLPESMTDQTRTGTYGSWYSYYVCGFSGRHHAARTSATSRASSRSSTARQPELPLDRTRCNGAAETPYTGPDSGPDSGVVPREALHRRPDHAARRDHPGGDAARDGGRVQPLQVPRLRRRHLPGGVHRRERAAQGQHGPGRRHPGRPGPGRRARQEQGAGDLRGRPRRRVRQGEQGLASRCSTCSARSTST